MQNSKKVVDEIAMTVYNLHYVLTTYSV